MNIIQSPVPKLVRGLVLGWGVPEVMAPDLCKALPGWAIVATPEAPAFVTFQHYADARRRTNVPREAPVIALGVGDGYRAIRCLSVSGFLDVWRFVLIARPKPQATDPDAWIWTRAGDKLLTGDKPGDILSGLAKGP